jgi:hypothetical protein
MNLYHYCSNRSFALTVQSKKLHLSLLTLSNDSHEGKHVRSVLEAVLNDAIVENGTLPRGLFGMGFGVPTLKQRIIDEVNSICDVFSAVGYCLSQQGDLLSQWRGYADDATGVAIGFDLESLNKMLAAQPPQGYRINLAQVVYKLEDAKALLRPIADHLLKLAQDGKFDPPRRGTLLTPMTPEETAEEDKRFELNVRERFFAILPIAGQMFSTKNAFFKEEEEWRMLAIMLNGPGMHDLEHCQFRYGHDRIVPYLEFPASGLTRSAITEVVLGPKHQTPPEIVESFLRSEGFDRAKVRRSTGTYR